ncbi:pentatricopeptide repeat-containing protein At5g66520-like [Neltuma alba]|uniref:pentatricopeptide repeat-containing protein At5g66520-like n=1 Tax=Neltuma alba TaxID=207710 RepID=UPI0010A51876|nr:pentatricopeptide repeat-containing protein At5g66520-like [Prosopis alba]
MISLHMQVLQPSSVNHCLPTRYGVESCSSMAELKQHHSFFIKLGLSTNNDAMGRIIKFCSLSSNGNFPYAVRVFCTTPNPDVFIYNTIMKGYLQNHLPRNCILLYSLMLEESLVPNSFTFPSVIRACCVDNAIKEGKQVHAHVVKFGFGADSVSQNNLIYMYANFKSLDEARMVFDKMPVRDVVSWTTLITGYSQWGFTDDAFNVFELMSEKNSVSWNAMIASCVQSNRFQEAFALFNKMEEEKVELNKFVAASILTACTGLGALEQGKWIHKHIEKTGIELDTKLASTIIDMYCKCGCPEKAFEVFSKLPEKGVSSWNSMIGGLAMHGKGEDAIKLFRDMEKEMIPPDYITFVNLLSACAHSGLVEEGQYFFHYMINVHDIEPKKEHYGCMVDLLARAGMLEEARNIIDNMPMSPDASILGALLGACKIHHNVELGQKIGKMVIDLEPGNSGRYVTLANIYANAGRWEDVANIRKLMNDRGVKKEPGFSIIEMDGVMNEFIAGEMAHPRPDHVQAQAIYAKAEEMLESIRLAGYVPCTDAVLHDLVEEERENPLFYHSEKLAVAYGLLRTKQGETLRITKNLRICRDCHQAIKLISKVFDRGIIIRDRNRFHHFSNGDCSCRDYW